MEGEYAVTGSSNCLRRRKREGFTVQEPESKRNDVLRGGSSPKKPVVEPRPLQKVPRRGTTKVQESS